MSEKRDPKAAGAAAAFRNPTSNQWFRWSAYVILGLWVVAYADSLGGGFHFDDSHCVERNLWIRRVTNIPTFFIQKDPPTSSTYLENANYRPVVTTTLAIDYMWAGLQSVPFHLTNVLLLLLVAVLFFHVARAIFDQSGDAPWHRWAALFSAGLFLVHTGNSEVGNYVTSRSESLCAAGVLGSFFVYLKWPKLRPFQLFLIPMALGAMAKTPAVIFGPLLILYKILYEADLSPSALKTDKGQRRILRAVLTGLPALVAGAFLFKFVEGMNPTGQSYGGGDKVQYFWTQAFIWLRYLYMFVLPMGLSADNDYALIPTWKDPRVIAGLATLVLSLAIAVWAMFTRKKEYRPIALGIVWFWAGIAPTSSFFPLGETTNDHRAYLGWLGLTLAVMTVVFERGAAVLAKSPRPESLQHVFLGICGAILVAHAIGTACRSYVWLDDARLWKDTVEKSPHNGRAWMNYGLTAMGHGDYAEARRAFDAAYKLTPYYSVLAVNRAILENATGHPEKAEELFREAKTFIPRSGAPAFFYAQFLINQGRGPEAVPQLEEASSLDSSDTSPRHMLMELAYARDQRSEVNHIAAETLAIGPDPEARAFQSGVPPFHPPGDASNDWFQFGLKFTNGKQPLIAAEVYRTAADRDPNNADAWNSLGWSLDQLGFYADAASCYRRTLALRPTDERAKNNLTIVLRRLGPVDASTH